MTRGVSIDSVHELHAHGRVYKDLKPRNVLFIKGKDLPQLADFGLCCTARGVAGEDGGEGGNNGGGGGSCSGSFIWCRT